MVIGSYSSGQEAPSLFHYEAAQRKAHAVLSEINPSYVLRHDGYYYVVTEHKDGLIVVLDPSFKVVSRVRSMGDDPCHLSIDSTGKYLVATNYSSGSTIVCELNNHIPSLVHSFITHEGCSNHPERQTSPHPHSTVFSEDNSALFLADLGTDWVHWYEFKPENIIWHKDKSLKLENSGPRTLSHGAPGSSLLYLSCELDNSVRVLSYQDGSLKQRSAYKVSTNELNFLSEVKYISGQVYLGLRGDDKVMVFHAKEDRLELNFSFRVGSWPRHFAATAEGTLFVACQKQNLVQKYQVSSEKILLLSEMEITTPSAVVIL